MATVLALPLSEPLPSAARAPTLVPVESAATQPRVTSQRARRAVWLSIHLPNWSLHAAIEALSAEERASFVSYPLAVVDQDRRCSVLACNDLAQQQGIRPGHSLNAAIALSAEVKFLPRNEHQEAQRLRQIASHCERYTSMVSLQPPNELLLEVRGSFRLFGGLPALLHSIETDLQGRGFIPQLAIAPTAQSALWLSRVATTALVIPPRRLPKVLAALPVGCLHWPAATQLRLARFGIRTLGELLRLPRGGLARRIGHARLAELDQALGRHAEVRVLHRTPERYVDRVLLDFDIATTALLAVILQRRLERLDRFLRRRERSLSELQIILQHRDHPATTVNIGLARATTDVAHLYQLAKVHLDRLALAAPVTELIIRVERLTAANLTSRDLFASTADQSAASPHERQARLLEQLRSRLGAHAVRRLQAAAHHRPESAQARPEAAVDQALTQHPPPAHLPLRPLWLLREPRLVIEAGTKAPRRTASQSPEVIESGWWDAAPIERHYYQLPSRRSQLCWTFQDMTQPSQWYVHGLFA